MGLADCFGADSSAAAAILFAIPALFCLAQAVTLGAQRYKEAFLLHRELSMLCLINLASFAVAVTCSQLKLKAGRSAMVAWLSVMHYATPLGVFLSLGVSTVCLLIRLRKVPSAQLAGFDDMFINAPARQAFEQYLHLEFCAELAMFCDDVDRYKEIFSDAGPEPPAHSSEPTLAQNNLRKDMVRKAKMGIMARNIFNKYISESAALDIRASGVLRAEITHRVTSNSISLNMFDSVQDHVYEKMRVCYGRFVKHQNIEKLIEGEPMQ